MSDDLVQALIVVVSVFAGAFLFFVGVLVGMWWVDRTVTLYLRENPSVSVWELLTFIRKRIRHSR